MKPSMIKRLFIREFTKNRELTAFQKEQLTFLLTSIRLDYEVGLKLFEYIKENPSEIEAFINKLDSESKNEIKTLIKNLKFIHSHTLIETIKNSISDEDQIFEHLKIMESIKNNYKLPMEIYEDSIFKSKYGLKYVPQNTINFLDNKDFIDCGAFIGDSALMFIKDYNPNNVYSFEPLLNNYNFLLENIKLNNLEKIIPINKGLGEKSCIENLYSLGPSSYVSEKGNVKIDIISLDEFVSKKDLSVGLIKIHVEGFELEVLKGAKETIKKFKPVLLIGIYHNPEEFFGTKKYIQDLVPDYNFRLKFLSDIRPLGQIHLIAW